MIGDARGRPALQRIRGQMRVELFAHKRTLAYNALHQSLLLRIDGSKGLCLDHRARRTRGTQPVDTHP
jgi:hypothetical protein